MPEANGVTAAENKWIVVTGANKGLGYELCRILLEDKHPIIAACRTQEKADDTVARLREATGHDITVQPLQLDPSDPDSIKAGVAKLRESRDGKVGVLVSNAGMLVNRWDQQTWDDIMAVNYTGAISLAEQILPVLAEGGRIVNVSSGLGALADIPSDAYRQQVQGAGSLEALRGISFVPDDSGCLAAVKPGNPSIGVPVYSGTCRCFFHDTHFAEHRISKAMLNRATKLLSEDERLTSGGITISAVCPGWCRTDLGNSGSSQNRKPPSSAEDGARSIAWNVEHKQPGDINGHVWRHGEDIGF